MIAAQWVLDLPGPVRARRELRPLLYRALDEEGRLGELAAGERTQARGAYLSTLARSTQLCELAARLLDAAEARGLRLLPLKGALLGPALYGDPGARPMADLDLAAHPEDLDGVVALLGELGLRRSYPERARFSPRHGHDVSFLDERNFTVEIHYRLFHELAADAAVEPLFRRAIALELYGRARPVPSWDDHLFAVAVHAAAHAFGDSPLWIFDVALLIERAGGTGGAAAEAERRGAGAAFRAAMRTAAAALPSLAERFGESRLLTIGQRMGDALRDRLLALVLGDQPLARPPGRVPSLVARSVLTEDPRDAARAILRKTELRAVELGEWLRRGRGRTAA